MAHDGRSRRNGMTEVHSVTELTFDDRHDGRRTTLDPVPKVTFTGPDGRRLSVHAYADGAGRWKVRFSPCLPGPWHWTLAPQGSGAAAESGRFDVQPATAATIWAQHGPIGIHALGRAFAHADGTPVFWLADTVWAAPAHATLEEWQVYLDRRRAQGFNVVQINALPQWDASGPPLRAPFLTTDGVEDLTRPDPAYFAALDAMVAAAAGAGLIAAIVVVWFDNTPADNEDWALHVPRRAPFDDRTVRAFARYLVARYEAWGAVWIVSGDSGFKAPASVALYDAAAEAILATAARRPVITTHLNGGTAPSLDLNARDWLDVVMFQSCHFRDSAERARRYAAAARSFVPRRPVLNGEPCYDDLVIMDASPVGDPRGDGNPCNDRPRFGRDEVRRTSWVSVLAGANAGISYGAHGLWPWHREGQTYGPIHYGQPLDWRQALRLESSNDVALLKRFMQTLPWWEIEPATGLIADPDDALIACATAGENLLVAYIAGPCRIAIPSRLARAATVRWCDPVTGALSEEEYCGDNPGASLASPFGQNDSVLMLRKV
jgi:hypothetical protein